MREMKGVIKFVFRGALYFLSLNFSLYTNRFLPAPFLVNLEITKRCNLRCIHCAIRETPEKYSEIIKEEFSIKEVKEIIDSLKSLGTKYISISGGEPFLREDIFDIIEYAKKRDLGIHISSNGTLITKEIAKKVNDLGLDAISISLDATTPTIHDKIRGVRGAFNKTVAAIRNLVKYKSHTQVGISPIITNLNIYELEKLVDFARDLGVDAIRFQPWHESLGYKETADILDIKGERLKEIGDVMEKIIRKTRKYRIYTNSDVYLRGISRYFEDKRKIKINCFVGFFTCNISWKGDVVPCAFIEPVGNIRKETFNEIWKSKRFEEVRREIRRGNCPKCWMGCFIEPSLRCSLKYAIQHPLKYFSDLKFFHRFM